MKNFLKHLLTKNNLVIAAIFLIAAGVRFYNFPNRVTFWSEQARSLIVSANYIKEKPSLLGQEYFRVDSNSHTIYSGALFNYSLVPLLLISNYDPVKITIFFTLLNLFTGFVIYLVAKKIFNSKVALLSTVIFLFNDYMIYHSLFIWNYNYLPLIGILTLYFSWQYIKNNKIINLFLTGLLCGIGISLQFLFTPIALVVFAVLLWKSKKKFLGLMVFILALIIGNLPMLLFDIRHDFYNLSSLSQYLIDTLKGKSDAGFVYYYLLPFWPIGAILLGWLVSKFKKPLIFFVVLLYLFINFNSKIVNLNTPAGMPQGLTTKDIDIASYEISKDAIGDFNVAEVLDFDKRAYVLRYFTEFKYGKKPLGVTEYQNLRLLYVLAQKGYNFENSDVWEIKAGGDYKIRELAEVGNGYAIFKLEK